VVPTYVFVGVAPSRASLARCRHDRRPYAAAIKARISSTRHAVTRGPSFTGLGNRPDLTPAHQQDFFMGIIAGVGGCALGLPMICDKRKKPVSGSWFTRDAP
jgi:hypothetical protein